MLAKEVFNPYKFSFFSFLATFSDLMTKLGKMSSAYGNENCAVNGFGNLRAKPEACCRGAYYENNHFENAFICQISGKHCTQKFSIFYMIFLKILYTQISWLH